MSNHIIFSAYQVGVDKATNDFNTDKVKQDLESKGVKYIEVEGHWLGNIERSILVSAEHEQLVDLYCRLFWQDCYLKVDRNNNAELIHANGRAVGVASTSLGVWQQVCQSIAESQLSYTKHGSDYYVCSTSNLPSPSLGSRL